VVAGTFLRGKTRAGSCLNRQDLACLGFPGFQGKHFQARMLITGAAKEKNGQGREKT